MRLVELIKNLKSIQQAQELVSKEFPNVEFDLVELYMVNELSLESDIRFFDAEKIPNKLLIEVDGIKHVNFFPLYLAQEMVEDYTNLKDEKLSDEEIAKRMLKYRLKDA
jgi:hypothetical protein